MSVDLLGLDDEDRIAFATLAVSAYDAWRASGLSPRPTINEAFLIGFQLGAGWATMHAVEDELNA